MIAMNNLNNRQSKPIKKKSVKIDTPKLLMEISKRPILFDSTVKDFKKYNLRTQEWAQLGNIFNIKGSEAKVRWRSVRDGYLRHIRRTETNNPEERGNWIYYEEMSFFAPHIGRKRKKNSNNEDPNSDDSVSNKSFDFVQSLGTQVPIQEKTPICNETHKYEMLVESLDQDESIIDDEDYQEVHSSPVYVEPDEPIEEETLHYEPEHPRLAIGRNISTSTGFYDSRNEGDDNEKFLLSCLPAMRRLNFRKNMLARLRIQQFLYDIEFNEND